MQGGKNPSPRDGWADGKIIKGVRRKREVEWKREVILGPIAGLNPLVH